MGKPVCDEMALEPVTNREVLDMLLERSCHRERQGKLGRQIEAAALEYLEQQQLEQQTPERIVQFLTAIAEYGLSKEEELQLINLRPQSEIELSLIVYNYTP